MDQTTVPDPTSAALLRGPTDAIAALPHLLGFAPTESLIAVWVRDGAVALTQRIDLPGRADADAVAAHLVRTARPAQAAEVLVVIVSAEPHPPLGLPYEPLVTAVIAGAESAGVDVLDALLTDGVRYWSYRCQEGCCPPQGRVVEVAAHDRMAVAFGAPAPDRRREALAGDWAPDARASAAVEPIIEEWESDRDADIERAERLAARSALEAWRDAQITAIDAALSSGEAADRTQLARLLVGLGDVRVRDTIVWERAQVDGTESACRLLTDALRAAPDGYVAPVATVLALLYWQSGDGARASIALERALDDDPEYRLAHLVSESVGSGIPPGAWRQLVRGMSREQCRMPTDPDSPDHGDSV